MKLDLEDIRAAVSAGAISDSQAARIMALADARSKGRSFTGDMDEPFELFHGFNEVFITLGLIIAFTGWSGLSALLLTGTPNPIHTVLLGLLGMGGLSWMARYFTLKRRMNGPSSALAAIFAFCAGQFGFGLGLYLGGEVLMTTGIAFAAGALGMMLYWHLFRVPFSLFLVSIGTLGSSFCFIADAGDVLTSPWDFFLISSSGFYGWATFVVGVIALIFAMRFDMSDPHRVTKRATNGFWLHIFAAPTIVNSVAISLVTNGSLVALVLMVLFLVVLTGFAIVIDRRSFLIAASGYIAGLAYTAAPEIFLVGSFFLGGVLITLGAQWENLRGALMRNLPEFPGRDRLPPWRDGLSVE